METTILILLAILAAVNGARVGVCGDSWTAYKDEVCIKHFTNLESYDDAKQFCSAQGDDVSQGTLVMIKDDEMQNFLASYAEDFFDYIWLGGRYSAESAQFKWEDAQPLSYSNWMDGYPKDNVTEDECIELRPSEGKHYINIQGKWTHSSCRKHNMVMCQRPMKWSLEEAVREIISLRKQHAEEQNHLEDELLDVREELQDVRQELLNAREELTRVNSSLIPIGYIFVEYPGQVSPRILWPKLTWEAITKDYEGLFFRVEGAGSSGWGGIQAACAPRITKLEHVVNNDPHPRVIDIPKSGWSQLGGIGTNFPAGGGTMAHESVRLNTEDCEVRPRNQAVRMWKRIA